MSDVHARPDPDALLRRLKAEAARAERGKLRIFFGFAPGVGKTYRMLQVARDLKQTHNLDVVVGVVEDHRRPETARMIDGFEVIARRRIEYRGHAIAEFDLDAALERRPTLLLLDELAHTNAPGSRHPKRWQDVEELLRAGIDVFTTMNVQHVESLNDVVAQITRVRVRETVPDSVLDAADTIELVDITPEELLARLTEGKVYLPEQATRAAEHFFQRGNLLALRELALRRTAQHVDDEVREYRDEHGVAATWPAGERIMVCVGPGPSASRLIRAAARMAADLHCPWTAAYVEATTALPMSDFYRERLESDLRLAESLGGSVTRLSGVTVSEALLQYARKHNVTRLIIGKPTRSGFFERVRRSLLDDIVRGSAEIDVHVISGVSSSENPQEASRAREEQSPGWHYAASLGIIAVTLGMSIVLRESMQLPDLEMLYLLSVMLTAVWFGRGPSLLAAALGVACYDFFLVPPFHTFTVDDRRYFLTFAMMFAVGFVMSELAARLRRQHRDASSREERTAVLYALTRDLAATDDPYAISAIATGHAAGIFSSQVMLLSPVSNGELTPIGSAPSTFTLEVRDLGVAKWCYEHNVVAGLGTDTLPGASVHCFPLHIGTSRLGVLVLMPRDRSVLHADPRAFLDVFCRQVAVALERARLADDAKTSSLRVKTEEMRSSLLSAVSHDLRTPLASITGAATSLRDDGNLDATTREELIESVVDQAERLERLVGNLLDMTRLHSGELALRRDWVPLDEMIGSALTRLERKLDRREVKVSIEAEVPLVFVDPVLFEQVFVNLLENAEKYTPPDSPIEITARREGEYVVVDLVDHGPGLPVGDEARLFEKFYRGPNVATSGAGLGLAICKGIVDAHGGSIRAQTRVSGGASFHIMIPSGGVPPAASASGVTA